ncbi:hypothetical protein CC78DRAFT_575475 [Lojkania enalia]|uniref:PHD-type domain-containing protein n=1 Tax=Lojkania enalia TaxID=147567 RepID=A0A9P4N6W3_9PLEO|nr:hypothetical protein CC78DRAFT_575475 [Didymosphaeria enalia]
MAKWTCSWTRDWPVHIYAWGDVGALTPHASSTAHRLALTVAPILLHSIIDAWLEFQTRPSGIPHPERSPRCAMAEDATASALSEMTPQPAANPDAQTTVNDFLDYTEFFPSDLVRSLRLIGNLDSTYLDATLAVHELTKTYGTLPDIPANERADPVLLRKEIAGALDKAIWCRESTFAEATRLYEVAERHCHRLAIIKRKLQALPQPPSRDPTPVPLSPQASRPLNRGYDRTPRLHLHFDAGRHGAARSRDRGRKSGLALHRGHSYSSSEDSDVDSDIIDIVSPKKLKLPNEKTPKPLKPPRVRIPGSGTNVHSSIAGISTSNALAKLSPPPPDAKPGSKFAPWFKLTEYEMAVLRKQMKKNAIWCPSDTMIRRELERKGRGHANYEKEKARCEAAGEEFLDEDVVQPSSHQPAPTAVASTPVDANAEPVQTPVDAPRDSLKEDTSTVNKGMKLNEAKEAKKAKRESMREQAMRDAQELEDATRKIKEAAESLKELDFSANSSNHTPVTTRRKSIAKTTNKRKRETSPLVYAHETPTIRTRETSLASQDSGTQQPQPKRIRLPTLPPLAPAPSRTAPAPAPPSASTSEASPQISTPIITTPTPQTPVPLPEQIKTTTIQVPLAPEGPGTPTPKGSERPFSKATSRQVTPAELSTMGEPEERLVAPAPVAPALLAHPTPTTTAASTRPRRESIAPKAPGSPAGPIQLPKAKKTPTPAPELAPVPGESAPTPTPTPTPIPQPLAPVARPRSARGHMPTPKAQSEEPKPHESGKPSRELRRHSIFSQSAIAAPPAPIRQSARNKKPPPKGDITAGEEGQKTVTNVKRAQGSKNKKKKKADEEPEPVEDIDPNEPRYCICDDVSYGQMISCDNNCEKEWFHLECVNMTEKDIPSRRAKWYCPDCRQQLGVDAYGNPLIPPPLSGRRGNR